MAYDSDKIASMAALVGCGSAAAKPEAEPRTKPEPKVEGGRKPRATKPARKPKEAGDNPALGSSLDETLRKAGENRERRTRPISIAVKPSEYEAWKAAAERHGISLSALVTIVMNDYVERSGGAS